MTIELPRKVHGMLLMGTWALDPEAIDLRPESKSKIQGAGIDFQ